MVRAEGNLSKEQTLLSAWSSFCFLVPPDTLLKQHYQQLGLHPDGVGRRACSLVERLARSVGVVSEHLAGSERFSIGSPVLLELVHYLLGTILVHRMDMLSKTRGEAEARTAPVSPSQVWPRSFPAGRCLPHSCLVTTQY